MGRRERCEVEKKLRELADEQMVMVMAQDASGQAHWAVVEGGMANDKHTAN
jgi:hypothetical protein